MATSRTFLGGLVHRALREACQGSDLGSKLPVYSELVDGLFDAVPAAYATASFGELFRQQGRDASWVASLMASDSYMEGYSAIRLWQYAACLSDQHLAAAIRRHADDEARHSKMFTAALFKVFPPLEEPALRLKLESNSPQLSEVDVNASLLDEPDEHELLNSMMLINLYEIKALVLCKLSKPVVLAHAPTTNQRSLDRLFDAIERDEAHHIKYSASYLEHASKRFGVGYISESMAGFQDALNLVTLDEMQRSDAFH